jgi:hypothetical protein
VIQRTMTNLRQEFGNLTLDEGLVAREKIAANLQRVLNSIPRIIKVYPQLYFIKRRQHHD